MAHCVREQIGPLLVRPKQDQIDKALAYVRHHLGQISCVVLLDVISYDLVYLTVQQSDSLSCICFLPPVTPASNPSTGPSPAFHSPIRDQADSIP